ncbi:MAG TPA: RHS repeat-associated core domain-containing protein [Solirubrobacteraceae bacterium]|nr:RHS repeat-associated core domain-containing protein [Solirubrobacteraceae bacterium]
MNDTGDAAPRFLNSGTLRKTESSSATIAFAFDNDGAVRVNEATLSFGRGVPGAVSTGSWGGAGTPTLDGAFTLGADTELDGRLAVGWSGNVAAEGISGPGGSTLVVNGTLDLVDGGAPSAVGTLEHTGTISGDARLSVSTGVTWSGQLRDHAELVVGPDATGTLTNGTLDGATLRNDGALTLQGYTTVYGRNGAVIDNGGTFTLATTSCWGCSYQAGLVWNDTGDLAPRFLNTGTLRKTEASSATVGFALDNDGVVRVNEATVSFGRGAPGAVSTGSWSGAGTASLDGPFSLGAGTVVDGRLAVGWPGNVSAQGIAGPGGTLVVNGTLDLVDGGDPSQIGALEQSGTISGDGRLTVRDAVTWSGQLREDAELVLGPNATGTLTSGVIDGAALRNAGVVTQQGYVTITGRNGALIENSGTFTLATTNCWGCSYQAGLVWNDTGDVAPRFLNTGTLRKTGPSSATIGFGLDNDGVVRVDEATVSFGRGVPGAVSTGSWGGAGTPSLDGAFTLADGTVVDGRLTVGWPGTVTAGGLQGSGATLTVNGTLAMASGSQSRVTTLEQSGTLRGAGTLRVAQGLTWSGTLRDGAVLDVAGSATGTVTSGVLDDATFRNAGDLTQQGYVTVTGRNGALLENSGTYTLATTGCWGCSYSPGLVWQPNGDAAPRLVNTGTLRKTESSYAAVDFATDNDGTVEVTQGNVFFRRGILGETSSGSWSGTTNGQPSLDGPFVLDGATLSGAVTIGWSGAVAANVLHGSSVALSLNGGLALTQAAAVSRVNDLSFTGRLDGPGHLRVGHELTWGGGAVGLAGRLTVESGATGTVTSGVVDAATVRNEGSLTQTGSGTLSGRNGGLIDNRGFYTLNAERCWGCSYEAGIIESGIATASVFRNAGTLRKTEGSGTSVVTWAVENLGTVRADTGTLDLRGPNVLTTPQAEESYGPGNPATPNVRRSCAGKPVDCATGNQFEVHTDLAVGGRGLGLTQTRTYNSQAATTQTAPSPYGFGWTGAYTDRLVVEAAQRRATVHQADGSTVPFVIESGGTFGAPAWVQAKLVRDGTTFVYTLPNQVRYVFDADGRLSSQVDRNGNATTIGHDGAGRLTTVTDPAGRTLTYAYDGDQVSSVTDPSGLTVEYEYDAGELVEVRYEDDESPTWAFDYDGAHQLTHMTDARGGTTVTEYDAQHRATRQTDALNRTRRWEYLTDETRIAEPNGSTTHTWFDQGQPTRIVRAEGTPAQTSTRYVYDADRRNTEVVDGNGHTTRFTYDGAGNRTSATDPTGRTTRWTYDARRDVTSAESPGGKVTAITRDAQGNPTAISRTFTENGQQRVQRVEMGNDQHGQLTSLTDALGKVTTYEYDAAGNQTAKQDATGRRTTATFDAVSRMTSVTTPGSHTTTITRDRFGRPTKTTDPLGRETLTTYDDNGNVVEVTDPAGRKTLASYDAENQLLTETLGDGSVRHVAYDAMGAVASRTDGAGHTTTYHRDAAGNVTEIADPLDRRTVLRHDRAGNVTEQIDALSRSTTFGYDDADRPTRTTYPAPGAREVTYGYDAEGRQVRADDGTHHSTTTYDDLGRVIGTRAASGAQVAYGYDLADRRTVVRYPNGQDVTTAYDDAGRPTSVTDWLGNTTALGYDADANLTTKDLPGSAQDTYAYNAAGDLTGAAFDGATLDYGYSAAGELTSIASAGLPGPAAESYAYDAAARLGKDGLATLAYDLAGNATKLAGADPLRYDAAGQLTSATTGDGEATYGFDAAGQRRSQAVAGGATRTFGYDSTGNLTSVATDGTTDATYAYDLDGLRESKTVAGAADPTTFVWDRTAGVPMLLAEGETSYVHAPDGLPLASIDGDGEVRYFHHDRLGSTRSMTDASGARLAAQTFDAYGNVVEKTGTERIPFGFAGRYTDEETGLVVMGVRVYDPATGQFLTRDPLEDLTLEPYLYASGDPVNAIDPTGLISIRIGLPALQDVSDAAAGFGDAASGLISDTVGLATVGVVDLPTTYDIREGLGVNDAVDFCSTAYTGGEVAGTGVASALGGMGAARAVRIGRGAWADGRNGKDLIVSRKNVPTGGKKWRISPTGHRLKPNPGARRTPHWGRNLPHYHRRPGIAKHRPWEGGF